MRVTIEHREETSGALRNKRDYFVDCAIDFSDEERAIIKARGLHDHAIPTGLLAAPSYSMAPAMLRAIAPLTALVGFAIWMIWLNTESVRTLGVMMVIGAGAAWLYGLRYHRRKERELSTDNVSVRDIIDKRKFSIWAASPAQAKAADAELRDHLANLKALIMESAEVGGQETFEL
jgi:hypothetical protein